MQDTNLRNWILFFIIAIGLSFELMKHFPGRTRAGLMDGESPTAQSAPYSVTRGQHAREARAAAEPRPLRAAGNSHLTREMVEKFVAQNTPAATSFAEGQEKGGEGKKADEKCDEKNQKIDPKTGKKIPCKKKKKKEKKDEEDKKDDNQAKQDDRTKEYSKDDIDSSISEAIATGDIPQPLPQKPDDPFDSLEDWIKRLLNSPDLAETKRFIDHYQRNLVTADIFYRVTQLMLQDSREKMKQLGVMCAGLTPSVISFQLLAGVVKDERPGSAPRTDAEGFLNRYGDLGNLGILERVMRSGSASYATVLATQKVENSAQRYLSAPAASATAAQPTAQQQAQQAATLKKNISHFQRFVLVMQNLMLSSDNTVKEQARSSLSTLQNLLAAAQGSSAPNPDGPNNPPGPGTNPPGGIPPAASVSTPDGVAVTF